MNFDVIKQNIRTILEVSDLYDDLIKNKNKLDRKKEKIIEFRIEKARNYILKLNENIRKLVEKEKEELQKDV